MATRTSSAPHSSAGVKTTAPFDAWALPRSWLLHDDGIVVVACKPIGVSVVAPDRRGEHDLVARVRRLRPHEGGYLCAHSHLDRDVSGLVVFSADRSANASLAQQVQQGELDVTFLVCAEPETELAAEGTLHCWTSKDRAGVLRPVRSNTRGAKEVTVVYRIVDACNNRLMLACQCAGGARAIRAALAQARAPIAGDDAMAGPAAHRLMLHASRVRLRHPVSPQSIEVAAPQPWNFDGWIRSYCIEDLDDRAVAAALLEAAARRFSVVADGSCNALRLVHGEAEDLPGVDVEWYARHAVVWLNEGTQDKVINRVVNAVEQLRPDGVYVKLRPKQASRVVNACEARLVRPHVVRGTDAQSPTVIVENNLEYMTILGEGLSTGLFLDQRSNRAWVRSRSPGKAVLNLFAYTCGFTVAAAAGGARRTVSVDISKRSLDTGRRNLQANGLDASSNVFVCDDVISWVKKARLEGEQFDIVVLDPPSFGTSHRGQFVVQRDYVDLAAACMQLLGPRGGAVLACTNHRKTSIGKFRSWLREAAQRAGRRLESVEDAPIEPDFPIGRDSQPHMKTIRCTVGPIQGRRSASRRSASRRSANR